MSAKVPVLLSAGGSSGVGENDHCSSDSPGFQSYDSLPTVKSETIILDLNSALLKSSIYFSFKSYFKLFFFFPTREIAFLKYFFVF